MTRRIRLIPVVVALVVLLAGCGGGAGSTDSTSRPLKKLAVDLDGLPGPENVAIPMALERGYFEDAGLEVDINVPAGPRAPIPYLFDEFADISVTHEPQLAFARANGAQITAFGSLVSQPTAAMIWLKNSGIKGIADLKGKTIGTEGLGFQRAFLETILARAGLTPADVQIVNVAYDSVPALAKGQVDAIFGIAGNVEGIELEQRGLEPVITPIQDLGVPPYEELVLIVRHDRLASEGEELRAFVSAVLRGAAAAVEDPEAAAQAIKKAGELHPYYRFNRRATEAGLEATLPLLSTSGEMSVDQASGLVDWMHAEGAIERKLPPSSFLTNDYLPDS